MIGETIYKHNFDDADMNLFALIGMFLDLEVANMGRSDRNALCIILMNATDKVLVRNNKI